MRLTTAGLMLAASVLALRPVAAEDETFDQRLREASQNRISEAGRKYGEAFSKEFGAQYAPRLSACLKRTGGPAPDKDFQMLLKLAGDGQVEKAMVRPETKITACFRDLTKPTRYPAPPAAGYWYVVDMHFSKK
jgi:hypothetical protein